MTHTPDQKAVNLHNDDLRSALTKIEGAARIYAEAHQTAAAAISAIPGLQSSLGREPLTDHLNAASARLAAAEALVGAS